MARAQLASPGALAQPHASVEGISRCSKCHLQGAELAPERCYACHDEIKERAAAGRGLHGRMVKDELAGCQKCHHEHLGRAARLIDWGGPMEKFDHGRTGWPLRGKHAGEKCATCHEPRRIVDKALLSRKQKEGSTTWLGVARKCVACHFDEHRGQLGEACEKCHGEADWKPRGFDHGTTKYPLAGKHKAVPCAQCHPSESDGASPSAFPRPRATTFLKMAPLSHNRCTDCHTNDPHQGRFGQSCDNCHSVEGWKVIKAEGGDRKFHDKTRFPLRGLHANVPCQGCHSEKKGSRTLRLPHERCTDCHGDAHQGQLAQPACERCHTVEGWLPVRFELGDHEKTRYPLVSSHAAVPCAACHGGARPPTAAVAGSRTLGAARALLKRGRAAVATVRHVVLSAFAFHIRGSLERCETCHADVHAGQFSAAAPASASAPARDRAADPEGVCGRCHVLSSFLEVRFDHQRDSRYPLTGKHAQVACAGCHRAPREGAPVRYRPIDTGCATCHADSHAGQLGDHCQDCHQTASWKATGFSHDDRRFTDYRLEGQHRKAACERCHPAVDVGGGRKVTRYRPLPRECESCHADAHHGEFKGFVP